MFTGKRLKESPASKIFSTIILPTIIATIAATAITNIFSTQIASRIARKNLLNSIQNLYIGSSKEWIDSKLGQVTSYNLKPLEKLLFPKQYSKVVAGNPLLQ